MEGLSGVSMREVLDYVDVRCAALQRHIFTRKRMKHAFKLLVIGDQMLQVRRTKMTRCSELLVLCLSYVISGRFKEENSARQQTCGSSMNFLRLKSNCESNMQSNVSSRWKAGLMLLHLMQCFWLAFPSQYIT